VLKDPTKDASDTGKRRTGGRELGWFVLLWAGGVVSVTLVGGVIKLFLGT
jgi:hypothetical protein